MTLIVGRVIDGQIYIFADTAVSSSNRLSINPFTEGCLKSYIVNERLALAFADDVSAFEGMCETLLQMKEASEIVEFIEEAQLKRGLAVEVLVADAAHNVLWTVKDASVCRSSVGFLGDTQAFNIYQRYFNDPASIPQFVVENTFKLDILCMPEPVLADDLYGRMFKSFKAVIDDPACTSVGGVILPLCTNKGRFQYMYYASVFAPLDQSMYGKPLPFGTAANGGYAVELCTDEERSEPGFYFLQGGFGLFYPRTSSGFRRATIVRAENPAYFLLESSKSLGCQLRSGYMTVDHCIAAGSALQDSGKYEDALLCLEAGQADKSLPARPDVRDYYMARFAVALAQCGQHAKALFILNKCIRQQPDASKQCRNILTQVSSLK